MKDRRCSTIKDIYAVVIECDGYRGAIKRQTVGFFATKELAEQVKERFNVPSHNEYTQTVVVIQVVELFESMDEWIPYEIKYGY